MVVEEFLSGTFSKFNNNDGWVVGAASEKAYTAQVESKISVSLF
jgi:hypothetical protein